MTGLPTKTDLNGTPNQGVYKTALGELYDYLEKAGGLLPTNIEIDASVASNELIVAMKTSSGDDPSSSDSIDIAFRDTVLTDGGYTIVNYDSPKSITIPSGGSLGFDSEEAGYILIYAVYDGTNKFIGVTRRFLDEGIVYDTTAISPGANAVDVLYTSSALMGAAVRLIGKIRITYGASVWDTDPAEKAAWLPGMSKIINGSYTGTATGISGSPTVTVNYTLNDKVVTIGTGSVTGTSDSTSFSITGAPAIIRPSARVYFISTVMTDNTSAIEAMASIETNGAITFAKNGSIAGFTNGGTKGIGLGVSGSYRI